MFEPYSIGCMTCGARLRVRNRSLVGQILNCPKCQSMVLVQPPMDHGLAAPPASQPTASAAPAPPQPATPQGQGMVGHVQPPPVVQPATPSARPPQAPSPASPPPSPSPPPPVSAIPKIPTVPQAGWQKALPFVCAAVTGVVVAASLWIFLQNEQPQGEVDPPATPAARVDQDESKPKVEIASHDDPPAIDGSQEAVQTEPSAAADVQAAEGPPTADRQQLATAPQNQAVTQRRETPAEREIGGGDPTSNPLPAKDPSRQETAAAAPATDLEIVDSIHQQAAAHPLPDPLPDTIERMKIPLKGAAFRDTPLRNVAMILEQATSVPIKLDRGGLFRAGVEPQSSVRLEIQQATAAELLQHAVNRWGLQVVPIADHVLVTVPAVGEGELRSGRIELGRLMRNREDGPPLVAMLRQLVQPASWQPNGKAEIELEGTALRVTQNAVGYQQLQNVLDKLRVARALGGGHQNEDTRGTLVSRTRRAAADLSRTVSCGTNGQLPLERYLEQLAARARVEIALDEVSLWRYGTSPQAGVTAAADPKPLAALLTAALQPLGLTWRVLDEGLLEVTTPRAVAETLDIECYPLTGTVGAEQAEALVRRIGKEISPANWTPAGGSGVVLFDPAGPCLLVRQAQPIQRALEDRLTQWQLLDVEF